MYVLSICLDSLAIKMTNTWGKFSNTQLPNGTTIKSGPMTTKESIAVCISCEDPG